jgi:hypothetical protein
MWVCPKRSNESPINVHTRFSQKTANVFFKRQALEDSMNNACPVPEPTISTAVVAVA